MYLNPIGSLTCSLKLHGKRPPPSNRYGKSPPSLKSDIIKYILGGATKLYSRNYSVPLFKRSLILNILVIVC